MDEGSSLVLQAKPVTLYQVVLQHPDSAYFLRAIKELNDEFNILWIDN